MAGQIEPIAMMAQQLSRLPGIGAKTAQRLAYHIVSLPEDQVHELASAIWQGRKAVKYCSICGNYTVEDPCPICADERRHNGVICVVRDPRDVAAMERMRDFKGCYHVLHGTISPMEGVGPEDIRIRELLARVGKEDIHEVIPPPIRISRAKRRRAISPGCSSRWGFWSRASRTACLSAAISNTPTR